MAERDTPRRRDAFPRVVAMPLRWADVDRYGHVNNVTYLAWFDTVVNDTHILNGFLRPGEPYFIVARTGCTYFAEVAYRDRIEVGLRVARLGTSSVTFELAVFGEGEVAARAQGEFVHVLVGPKGGRPIPIEGAMRDYLEALQ